MKRTIKTLLVASAIVLGSAGAAQAYSVPAGHTLGEYQATVPVVDMNVQLNEGYYYHEFDLAYVCGTDGTITFSGIGQQFDNNGETLTSGVLDLVNHTVTYDANYNGTSFNWGPETSVLGAGTYGDIDWSGTWNGYTLAGGFHNVPNCAPAPVVGNHGEYVSGAAHAGVKGKNLALAAQSTKVGPYDGFFG